MSKDFSTGNLSGEEVRCVNLENQMKESDFLARHIKKFVTEGGWSYGDIAILYRMNSMSEPIERAFTTHGVDYVVIGGRSFYDRAEIKDCLSILKFVANPKDGIAFHRICKFFNGMGDKTIGLIETIAMDENVSLLEAARKFKAGAKLGKIRDAVSNAISKLEFDKEHLSTSSILRDIVDKFGIEAYLLKEYGDDGPDRLENINQLIVSAGQYAEETGNNSIDSYLQTVSLISSSDKDGDKDRVSLMTLHASKGLEFPIVFIIGVEQSILPHSLSVAEDPFEGVEEERRLLYVGMTRAEKVLFVTHCKNRLMFAKGGNMYNKKSAPSQFLYEAGLMDK
jgi:DNA helicase-2/ATP-dependent DNA helicase PcrA